MPILLLVGNGLSIDLTEKVVPVAERLDTTRPLGWKFPIRAAANRDVFEVLSELRETIIFVRKRSPGLSDFETIREVSQISAATPQYAPILDLIRATNGRWVGHLRPRPYFVQHPLDQAGTILRHQLRLFLCAAFVHFYDAHAALTPGEWRWFRWLASHGDRLGLVCSFNYDLVAEWTFARASGRGLGYLIDRRPRDHRLLTFKPHGSINFQVPSNALRMDGNIYENGNIFERNDTPITVVTNDRLHESRLTPDIVLPMEYSAIGGFQSVACGYEHVRALGATFDHCVVGGLSYWEQDRPELDTILAALRPETTVTVVNPRPDPQLLAALERRFRNIRLAGAEPPSIDAAPLRNPTAA
jgi:hypothetical protein